MNKAEKKKALDAIQAQHDIHNFESNLNRARSVTVGTSFGGTTEVSMRGPGAGFLFCIMQPVEVIELIHQLAANVGCHINIKPREDFGSWREWRVSEAEKKHLNGHPPFPSDMTLAQFIGIQGHDQEKVDAYITHWLAQKEYDYVNGAATMKPLNKQGEKDEQSVATKKTVNRRSTKRGSKAS